jgi:hypothetical protein
LGLLVIWVLLDFNSTVIISGLLFLCIVLVYDIGAAFLIKGTRNIKDVIFTRTLLNPSADSNLFNVISRRFGPNAVLLFLVCFFVLMASPAIGAGHAKLQKYYLALDSDPSWIVLRDRGGDLLLTRIDPQSKALLGIFQLLSTSAGGVMVRRVNVGPLQSAPD